MSYSYNKDEIKENLTIENIEEILAELGGEPQIKGDMIISKTICHCGASRKLYYYSNTRLFKCYTECAGDAFDIFELVKKVKSREIDGFSLPQAIYFVAQMFGFSPDEQTFEGVSEKLEDWQVFENYDRINSINKETQIVELKVFEDNVLKFLPRPHIIDWEREGITYSVMMHRGICYDPSNEGIVIPHYDVTGRLVGIRERTLIAENEQFGKYRPAILNRKMFNHPLGFNAYNLNNSKNNIQAFEKAIVFEGKRKSCPSPLFLVTAKGTYIPNKCCMC